MGLHCAHLTLDDRIVFAPDAARHRYTLTVPIAFDRVLITVVPEWKGQLQEPLASQGLPSWNQISAFLAAMRTLRDSGTWAA